MQDGLLGAVVIVAIILFLACLIHVLCALYSYQRRGWLILSIVTVGVLLLVIASQVQQDKDCLKRVQTRAVATYRRMPSVFKK